MLVCPFLLLYAGFQNFWWIIFGVIGCLFILALLGAILCGDELRMWMNPNKSVKSMKQSYMSGIEKHEKLQAKRRSSQHAV